MAKTPTVNRLQLGAVLRNFRIDADLSQEQLGQRAFPQVARAAQTKLAAIESGDRSLHRSELVELQDVLGIKDPELVEWMRRMQENSSQRGKWRGHRAVFPESLRPYIDLEEDADLVRDVAVWLMPDLLMCESYIRATLEGRAETPELLEANVAARLARTALLRETPDVRRFHFVLGESAVRQSPNGDRAVVREQIAHVISLSKSKNITVQVVPFIRPQGAVVNELYPFTHLRIPEEGIAPSFEYVHIGAPNGWRYVNHPHTVDVYRQHFDDATEAGTGGDDARLFMQEISREYR